MEPVEAHILEGQAYADAFAAFLDGCPHDYDDMVDLATKHATRRLLSKEDDITLLSVGAGTGVLDAMLMRRAFCNVTRYIGLEPNDAQADLLEREMAKLRTDCESEGRKLKFEVRRIGWGSEFLREASAEGLKVDLILFSHCLYHIPAPHDALIQAARELLRPKGQLMAFLCIDSALSEMWRLFSHHWRFPPGPMMDHGINTSSVATAIQGRLEAAAPTKDNNKSARLLLEVHERPSALHFMAAMQDRAVAERILSFMVSQDVSMLPGAVRDELHEFFLRKCCRDGQFPHGNGLIVLSDAQ